LWIVAADERTTWRAKTAEAPIASGDLSADATNDQTNTGVPSRKNDPTRATHAPVRVLEAQPESGERPRMPTGAMAVELVG
jgi:hypothetical protein